MEGMSKEMSIEAQKREEYYEELGKYYWKRFERWDGKAKRVEELISEAALGIRHYKKRKEGFYRLDKMAYVNPEKYGYWKVYRILAEICERLENYYEQKWLEYDQRWCEYDSKASTAFYRSEQLRHARYIEKLKNMTSLEKVRYFLWKKKRYFKNAILREIFGPTRNYAILKGALVGGLSLSFFFAYPILLYIFDTFTIFLLYIICVDLILLLSPNYKLR